MTHRSFGLLIFCTFYSVGGRGALGELTRVSSYPTLLTSPPSAGRPSVLLVTTTRYAAPHITYLLTQSIQILEYSHRSEVLRLYPRSVSYRG